MFLERQVSYSAFFTFWSCGLLVLLAPPCMISFMRRHDTQHNDIQHYDTKHNNKWYTALSITTLSMKALDTVMLSVVFAEYYVSWVSQIRPLRQVYAECHYAECHSAIFAHLACSQNEVILFLEQEELNYLPINIGNTVTIF